MAIALVDTGKNFADGATTTIDITGIDVSGGNEVLYVAVEHGSSTSAPTGATVVWDAAGANQSFGAAIASNSNPSRCTALFRLIAPAPGTNKTISIGNLSAVLGEVAQAASYSGVDQTTPNGTIDAVESGGGGAVTTTASGTITCAPGNWIVSFAHIADSTPNFALSGNQTIRDSIASGVASNNAIALGDDRDGANNAITWTHDSQTSAGAITFELKAAAGAIVLTPSLGSVPLTGHSVSLGLSIGMPDVP